MFQQELEQEVEMLFKLHKANCHWLYQQRKAAVIFTKYTITTVNQECSLMEPA